MSPQRSETRFGCGLAAAQAEQKDESGEQMGGCLVRARDLCEQSRLGPSFLVLMRRGVI